MSVCISVYEAHGREHTEKTCKKHGASGVASMKDEGLRSSRVDSRMLLMAWLLRDELMKTAYKADQAPPGGCEHVRASPDLDKY